MAHRHLHPDSPWLLALLAALVALGPLSVDMYLPAMPRMMSALNTDISHMHLTLSTYLTGFALFHLICGPLADRIGRKPVILGGTVLFILACIGCSQSDTVEELIFYRFLQGVGACVGPTLARTIARDVFGPTRAARALSLIAMLMALAPAIAPTLGGILLLWLPWPIVFLFLAFYGLTMIVLIQVYLAETIPQKQSLHPIAISRNYMELLRDPIFIAATLCSGFIYAGLLTYLSSSSFVYIDMLGVRLSKRFMPEQTVLLGTALAAGASASMLAGTALFPASLLALILPMIFYSAGMGLVLPNAMAVALRPFPHIAGTASALLGFIQMGLSSSATALVGLYLKDTPAPMVYLMFFITVSSLGLGLLVYSKRSATSS
jgi:DHA1 family bicyclomycin/chloramphenicol resistance-like MFS transporter